jgi:hypothetical protein
MDDPRSSFENEFLNDLWAVVGNKHVLLLLDEAVRLQEQVEAGKLEHEVFEYIRHLMQHHERLNFLFSLGSGLEEMEKEYSFLFSVGLYKKISFLDKKAASDLITLPVKDYYSIEPDAVIRIFQITSGHPYFIQLLCHCLFNSWKQQRMAQMGIHAVDNVLEEVVERGSAVLKHVWEESTPGEKAFMAGMVTAMGKHNHSINVEAIAKTWMRCNVMIPSGEMTKAIRSLISRDIIVGQDQFMFTIDLQRLWIQKHRRLEWVKEEIADFVAEWHSQVVSKIAKTGSGLAIAGLIVGIVSIVVSILPILGLLFSIVGLLLAIMGHRFIAHRTMATVGIVISSIGLALTIFFLFFFYFS